MSKMTENGLEIYLYDLNEETQKEFRRYVKDDADGFNIYPIATVYVQTPEEQEETLANSTLI